SNALAPHAHCPTLVIPARWDEDGTESLFAPRQDLPGGEAAATESARLVAASGGVAAGGIPAGDAAAAEPASAGAAGGNGLVGNGSAAGGADADTNGRRSFKNVPDALNFDGDIVAAVDLGESAAVVIGRAAELAQLSGRSLTLVSANPVTVGTRFPNPGQGALEMQSLHDYRKEHLAWAVDTVREAHPDMDVTWRLFDGSAAGVLSEATRT